MVSPEAMRKLPPSVRQVIREQKAKSVALGSAGVVSGTFRPGTITIKELEQEYAKGKASIPSEIAEEIEKQKEAIREQRKPISQQERFKQSISDRDTVTRRELEKKDIDKSRFVQLAERPYGELQRADISEIKRQQELNKRTIRADLEREGLRDIEVTLPKPEEQLVYPKESITPKQETIEKTTEVDIREEKPELKEEIARGVRVIQAKKPIQATISGGEYGDVEFIKPVSQTKEFMAGFTEFPKVIGTGIVEIGKTSFGVGAIARAAYEGKITKQQMIQEQKGRILEGIKRPETQAALTLGVIAVSPALVQLAAGSLFTIGETEKFLQKPSYTQAGKIAFIGAALASPYLIKKVGESIKVRTVEGGKIIELPLKKEFAVGFKTERGKGIIVKSRAELIYPELDYTIPETPLLIYPEGQLTLFGTKAKSIKPTSTQIVPGVEEIRVEVSGVRPIYEGMRIVRFESLEPQQAKLSDFGLIKERKFIAFDLFEKRPAIFSEKDITIEQGQIFVKRKEAERYINVREISPSETEFRKAQARQMVQFITTPTTQTKLEILKTQKKGKPFKPSSLDINQIQENILESKKSIPKQIQKPKVKLSIAELTSGAIQVRPVMFQSQDYITTPKEDIIFNYGKQLPAQRQFSELKTETIYTTKPLTQFKDIQLGKERIKPIIIPISKSVYKSKIKSIQSDIQSQKIKVEQKVIPKQKITPVLDIIQKQDIILKQELRQVQSQKTIFKLRQGLQQPSSIPKDIPIEPTTTTINVMAQASQSRKAIKQNGLKKTEQAYIPEIREREGGKFVPIGKKQPLSTAFNKAARIVDKYANRTFRLRATTDRVKSTKEQINQKLASKFRESLLSRNVFIEKSSYAIDSPMEKQQIPYKAARIRRGTRLLKK